MVIIVKCGKCGKRLYYGKTPISLTELMRRHNWKCPNCGKKLELKWDSIKIEPARVRRLVE